MCIPEIIRDININTTLYLRAGAGVDPNNPVDAGLGAAAVEPNNPPVEGAGAVVVVDPNNPPVDGAAGAF